jgi:hypothetical protein
MIRSFYTPSDGRTYWAVGYVSRDGCFYRTSRFFDSREAAERVARSR